MSSPRTSLSVLDKVVNEKVGESWDGGALTGRRCSNTNRQFHRCKWLYRDRKAFAY